jgi:hypothetical protein
MFIFCLNSFLLGTQQKFVKKLGTWRFRDFPSLNATSLNNHFLSLHGNKNTHTLMQMCVLSSTHIMMSSKPFTMGIGPDSDMEVSLPSFFKDDQGNDYGGSSSDRDFFSTISFEGSSCPEDVPEESGPTGVEAVEGMELGLGGSPKGLEFMFRQMIA